jgi:two-component system sensor histidine kinase KdpD
VTLHGDIATELIRYAREKSITQIVLGHSDRSRWRELLHGSIINRLVRALRTVDIVIVAHAKP